MVSIEEILSQIIHPESGQNIVQMGMVQNISQGDGKISFTLLLTKANDPQAASLRHKAERAVFQATAITPTITVREKPPVSSQAQAQAALRENSSTAQVARVVAVASGKGGVGKSSVTVNLALALVARGFKVGVLDADIYGPSIPKMFGTEGYEPLLAEGSKDRILPAEAYGVKHISIGHFIKASDALVWRGPMATNALRQLIHQTAWGELDFLLIDLPPGTGDVHLSVMAELKVDEAIIVTTPQMVALADVVRGIAMFRAPALAVPVRGIVANMAYFVPEDDPQKRYYIFGRDNVELVALQTGLPMLATIPLTEQMAAGGDSGAPCYCGVDDILKEPFDNLAASL
ncbi:MAG: Mrp/NBP35 family ATP-binding protein [Mucinivorans sp.]